MENKIREYRKEKGMSQSELAHKVGLARQTVGLIESENYNPSLKVCLSFAEVLDTTLDKLFNPKFF